MSALVRQEGQKAWSHHRRTLPVFHWQMPHVSSVGVTTPLGGVSTPTGAHDTSGAEAIIIEHASMGAFAAEDAFASFWTTAFMPDCDHDRPSDNHSRRPPQNLPDFFLSRLDARDTRAGQVRSGFTPVTSGPSKETSAPKHTDHWGPQLRIHIHMAREHRTHVLRGDSKRSVVSV